MLSTRTTYGLSPRYPLSIPRAFSSLLPLQTKDEDYDGLEVDGSHSSGLSPFVSVSALAGIF